MTEEEVLQINLQAFPWESEAQKEGYLNYLQYLRSRGKTPPSEVPPLVVYLIQKDHESNEYWRELVGDQVSTIHGEIHGLQSSLRSLEEKLADANRVIDLLIEQVKAQGRYVDMMKPMSGTYSGGSGT